MRKILVIGMILATMLMVGCGNQEAAEHEQSVWNEMESASIVPDQDGEDTLPVKAEGNSVVVEKVTDTETNRKLLQSKESPKTKELVKELCADFSGTYKSEEKTMDEIGEKIASGGEYILYFGNDLNAKLQSPEKYTSFAVMGDYAYFISETRYNIYFKKINSKLIKSLF